MEQSWAGLAPEADFIRMEQRQQDVRAQETHHQETAGCDRRGF
jgi:hypothetical protein